MKTLWVTAVVAAFGTQSTLADVCDHRPSKIVGSATTKVVGAASGLAAAAGTGMKAAGLYTLTNASTGAAMIGSTAAGASAAGTTGIVAGTSGALGTAGAVLMSPFVLIPAAVAAVGIGAYEGGCHLADKQGVRKTQTRR